MAFETWTDYWNFERSVKTELRYRLSNKSEAFLKEVWRTGQSRIKRMDRGKLFWRAQIGHDWREESDGVEMPSPFGAQRMKPRKNQAMEGRVNAKGIPCLYLATHKKTAVSETRAWVGAPVSVAQFKLEKPAVIMDCSIGHPQKATWYFEEPDEQKREEAVWLMIDRAFSEPVAASDDVADYAPTQILSEFFREQGIDGVVYKSGLGEGFNIALFDIEAATPINCSLFNVKEITVEIEETTNPWFSASHYGVEPDA